MIKGVNIEGFTWVDSMARFSIAPGIGLVSRTLDDATMNSLVATLNTYPEEDRFVPKYNTYAFTIYNTLRLGAVTWYAEAAFKTDDNLNDPFGEIVRDTTTIVGDQFFLAPGSVIYNSLSYAADNWGLTLEAKRTENFSFRTRPQVLLNRGLVNFLPPLTRVNTYRLTSRYNAATQELGEWAVQADLRLAPTPKWSINLNGTLIDDLEGQVLYREFFTDVTYKYERLWRLTTGLQMQRYNQERYEFKPGVPLVETLVPFLDFQYRLDRRKSVRAEFQYMKVGKDETAGALQDYGNWLFGLLEYNVAPNWTFSVADMYNVSPGRNSPRSEAGERLRLHYPRVDVFYTSGPNRFSASYVKQVEGVVCTGGICRLEPAFSGVKIGVSSTF